MHAVSVQAVACVSCTNLGYLNAVFYHLSTVSILTSHTLYLFTIHSYDTIWQKEKFEL
jgi:hypothetical protein